MKLLNPLNSEVATAVAAAVEQQAAATREIASSVQTVTAATHEATKAMQEVSSISENTDAASRKVLSGADEVNRNADTLRGEVTEFLQAMASTSDEDRRRYERIAGHGAEAVLRARGGSQVRGVIVDISRGGGAVRCDWQAEVGAEVEVEMPDADRAVYARCVRSGGGQVGLAFRQDEMMLRCVDQAMARIGAGTRSAAA